MTDTLESDITGITTHVLEKQKALDEVMVLSRGVIMDSGRAITMLHTGREAEARAVIAGVMKRVERLKRHDGAFRYASLQAYQEYAEAAIFYGIKKRGSIPGAKAVGVDEDAYLLGLMDVVGELKREVLEALGNDSSKEAGLYFEMMKRIYDGTRGLKFAEAVLHGFRKKQDVARIQLESAGSELLHAKR